MSQDDKGTSILEDIKDLFDFLINDKPTPDDEIEAQEILIENFKKLRELDAYPKQADLIKRIIRELESWDTLEHWFFETDLPDDIRWFIEETEEKPQEKKEQPIETEKKSIQEESAVSEEEEIKEVEEKSPDLDISKIIQEVTSQFKGEIGNLEKKIESLQKRLKEKDDKLGDVKKKIEEKKSEEKKAKAKLEKKSRLPPLKIELPSTASKQKKEIKQKEEKKELDEEKITEEQLLEKVMEERRSLLEKSAPKRPSKENELTEIPMEPAEEGDQGKVMEAPGQGEVEEIPEAAESEQTKKAEIPPATEFDYEGFDEFVDSVESETKSQEKGSSELTEGVPSPPELEEIPEVKEPSEGPPSPPEPQEIPQSEKPSEAPPTPPNVQEIPQPKESSEAPPTPPKVEEGAKPKKASEAPPSPPEVAEAPQSKEPSEAPPTPPKVEEGPKPKEPSEAPPSPPEPQEIPEAKEKLVETSPPSEEEVKSEMTEIPTTSSIQSTPPQPNLDAEDLKGPEPTSVEESPSIEVSGEESSSRSQKGSGIAEIKVEEVEKKKKKATAQDLYNVFSAMLKDTETKGKSSKKKSKLKESVKSLIPSSSKSEETKSAVQGSEVIPETEVEEMFEEQEGIEIFERGLETLPDDKDMLYQELIAMEGKRYSLEKDINKLEDRYEKGTIDELDFKNEIEKFKENLEKITSYITDIRRKIATM